MKELTTYIIYYHDSEGNPEGYEVYGIKQLKEAMKWLHKEVKATSIEVYKRGKDFNNNSDDVVELRRYWK